MKKIHGMVKVDETGAKILSILIAKFAFFNFDVMRMFENGILCFNVFCISVII